MGLQAQAELYEIFPPSRKPHFYVCYEWMNYVAGAKLVSSARPSRAANSCRALHKRAFNVLRETPRTCAASSAESPSISRNQKAVRSKGEISANFFFMRSPSSVPA